MAYWRRFVRSLQELKSRIIAGEMGQIYLAACYQWDQQPPTGELPHASGGIFVMDMAVHEFDQIRWLCGQEIAEIQAVAAGIASDPPVDGDAESAQVLSPCPGGTTGLVSFGRLPAGRCMQSRGIRHGERGGMPLPLAAFGRRHLPQRVATAESGYWVRRSRGRCERARRRRGDRCCRTRLADLKNKEKKR